VHADETTHQRVRSLQLEIAVLREESQLYLQRPRHSNKEISDQSERELRLLQILNELASLSNKQLRRFGSNREQ
jgi:hypothetical protein